MRSVLLEEMGLGQDDFTPIVVWIDMLPADNWEAAQQAAKIFSNTPFVAQFYDPRQLVGGAVAASLGAPGKTAWDIYLRYAPDSRWGKQPPQPTDWAHQMDEGDWAGEHNYHTGEALHTALTHILNPLPDRNRI